MLGIHRQAAQIAGCVAGTVAVTTMMNCADAQANPGEVYALPACYSQSALPTERPARVTFQFCADAGTLLEGLTWSDWNPQNANGGGTFSLNDCQPTCVAGHWLHYPTKIHAATPLPAQPDSGCPPGTQFFSELFLSFPAATPNSNGQIINSQYQGLPTIAYSTVPNRGTAKDIGQPTCH